jgi:hypothetical protein
VDDAGSAGKLTENWMNWKMAHPRLSSGFLVWEQLEYLFFPVMSLCWVMVLLQQMVLHLLASSLPCFHLLGHRPIQLLSLSALTALPIRLQCQLYWIHLFEHHYLKAQFLPPAPD